MWTSNLTVAPSPPRFLTHLTCAALVTLVFLLIKASACVSSYPLTNAHVNNPTKSQTAPVFAVPRLLIPIRADTFCHTSVGPRTTRVDYDKNFGELLVETGR